MADVMMGFMIVIVLGLFILTIKLPKKAKNDKTSDEVKNTPTDGSLSIKDVVPLNKVISAALDSRFKREFKTFSDEIDGNIGLATMYAELVVCLRESIHILQHQEASSFKRYIANINPRGANIFIDLTASACVARFIVDKHWQLRDLVGNGSTPGKFTEAINKIFYNELMNHGYNAHKRYEEMTVLYAKSTVKPGYEETIKEQAIRSLFEYWYPKYIDEVLGLQIADIDNLEKDKQILYEWFELVTFEYSFRFIAYFPSATATRA